MIRRILVFMLLAITPNFANTTDCEFLEVPVYTGQSWCFELPDPNAPEDPNEATNDAPA